MLGALTFLRGILPVPASPMDTDHVSQVNEDSNSAKNQEIVEEVYDLIKDIKDPEREQTLEELDVVKEDLVKVSELGPDNYAITIGFIPTVPHCSLATLIGLCMKVKLERDLQFKHKLEIFITPGTHSTADEINKQINDKERVAAAMENPGVMEVVQSCLEYIENS